MTLTIKGFKGTVSAVRLNQRATKNGTGDLKISINGNNVVSKSFTKQEISARKTNTESLFIFHVRIFRSSTWDDALSLEK